jgi:hypothetical protein
MYELFVVLCLQFRLLHFVFIKILKYSSPIIGIPHLNFLLLRVQIDGGETDTLLLTKEVRIQSFESLRGIVCHGSLKV